MTNLFYYQRATIAEIREDKWFLLDYQPSAGSDNDDDTSCFDDKTSANGVSDYNEKVAGFLYSYSSTL